MPEAPSGTITFLFTDIEGSTRLWELFADEMRAASARHDALLRESIEAAGGHVFKTVGDGFCAAFGEAPAAVRAAFGLQSALAAETWGRTGPIRVRGALHSGTADQRDGDYFGPALNRVARLRDAAHGGQVLLTQAAAALVGDRLPDGCALRDLGHHRLRDIETEERVFQLMHPALPATFPPLRTERGRHNNLPAQRTSFVGREREIGHVSSLLSSGARLVTLTGPGGSGKTRLALAVAAACEPQYEHGVCFVGLGALTDPGEVDGAIARALGLREGGESPLRERLLHYLRERALLLVLDNFEHLLDAGALVSELVDASRVQVLATSQAPLRLYGEHEFAVPPLHVAGGEGEAVTTPDAVRLFVERARAASPGFSADAADAAAVRDICARLGGIPLAIELAAARVKVLSPAALLERLDRPLRVLTGGARDAPERQRTMRSTIAWSHGLLEDEEQRLFRRLSVFAGGCTLEGAERVCGAGEDCDVMTCLASLVEKHLLQRGERAGGAVRFSLQPAVREFAAEQLEAAGEAADFRGRQAAEALRFMEEAHQSLYSARQIETLAATDDEIENVHAALAWAADAGRDDLMLRLAVAAWPYWRLRGLITTGRGWLSRALATGAGAAELRARGFHGLGALALNVGDLEAAREALASSIALSGEGEAIAGRATSTLGIAVWMDGDAAGARALWERAVSMLRGSDDRWGLADALHYLGHVSFEAGEMARAEATFAESLALFRETGDPWSIAQPLKDLGLAALRQRQFAAAWDHYREGLALLQSVGEKWHLADTYNRMGEVSLFQGDLDAALAQYDEALAMLVELDGKMSIIETLNRMAEVALLREDYAGAQALYEDCLARARQAGNARLEAGMLYNLGRVARRRGDPAKAAAQLTESLALQRKLERPAGAAMCLDELALVAQTAGDDDVALGLARAAAALGTGAGTAFDRIEHGDDGDGAIAALRERAAASGAVPDDGEVDRFVKSVSMVAARASAERAPYRGVVE